jgi:hypothetical protein
MGMSRSVCGPAALRRVGAKKPVQHVQAEFLGLHVLGDLPILQRSQVDLHLSECSVCRDQLRHVKEVIAAFEGESVRSAFARWGSSCSPRMRSDRPVSGP